MADYYLVEHLRGPSWDPSKGRREQAAWDAHSAFMDGLADEGVVVLAGPVGDVNGQKSLLVCRVKSEAEIRARLAEDPWAGSVLTIGSVQPWTVWLRGRTPA
jgi:uncharacterized protein YciI